MKRSVKEARKYRYEHCKVLYIESWNQLDILVDTGLHRTNMAIKVFIKGMPQVPYPLYSTVKRIVSESLEHVDGNKKCVGIEFETNAVGNSSGYYLIYEADLFDENGVRLNDLIIEKVQALLDQNKDSENTKEEIST